MQGGNEFKSELLKGILGVAGVFFCLYSTVMSSRSFLNSKSSAKYFSRVDLP